MRKGKKGHFPAAWHTALVEQGQALLPVGAQVVWRGDGAGDGTDLQHTLAEAEWSYVCRTAMSTTATWEDTTFRLDTLGAWSKPETLIALHEVRFTEDGYGPILRMCCWAKGYQEPLDLISRIASADEACRLYSKRFRREPFCSDQKSRGFHMHTSPLSEPTRLARLLMATCFASIWGVYLGALCVQDGWGNVIHRGDRGDLSLFQLGLRLLDYLLNEGCTIPVAFYISI